MIGLGAIKLLQYTKVYIEILKVWFSVASNIQIYRVQSLLLEQVAELRKMAMVSGGDNVAKLVQKKMRWLEMTFSNY